MQPADFDISEFSNPESGDTQSPAHYNNDTDSQNVWIAESPPVDYLNDSQPPFG
jgi:hypothetical protein